MTQNRKINNKSWHSSEITLVKPSPGYFPRARMKTHFLKRKRFYLKKLSLFHLRQKSQYSSWSKQRIPQRNFAVLIRVFSKFKFSNENKVNKFPMNKDCFYGIKFPLLFRESLKNICATGPPILRCCYLKKQLNDTHFKDLKHHSTYKYVAQ